MSAVVVGVDGSAGSQAALAWAAEAARVRAVPLRVVQAYAIPMPDHLFPAGVTAFQQALEFARQAAKSVVTTMVADLKSQPELATVVLAGPAARVLVEQSSGADLLVVGSRGRGGFAGLLLGSVSQQCLQRASCPVVVVPAVAPAGAPEGSPPFIVVGVEGSADSLEALRWAVEEAHRRRAVLRVVHAYQTGGRQSVVDHLDQHARQVLDAATRQAAGLAPDVPVHGELARDEGAAEALLTRATGAALLVVGARGLGGLTGLLIGSVSAQCAHHAPCPVAVIRDRSGSA
jgi:nucleotide-binding universal stress UspA family protein